MKLTSGSRCAICGKGKQKANRVSHAKNRTHIVRKPNLHVQRMVVEGVAVKVKLCSKCKRLVKAKTGDGRKETSSKK